MNIFLKILLLNSAAFALLLLGWKEGYVAKAQAADITYIVEGIIVLTVIGVAASFRCTFYPLSRLFDYMTLFERVPVLLGFIGTLIGFQHGLEFMQDVNVSDISQVGSATATLLSGLAIAMYTTLAGALSSLLIFLNRQFLTIEKNRYV